MKKLISTEINSAARVIGEERAVELCAKAGFDAWDFSMFQMGAYDWTNKKLMDTGHPLQGKDYAEFAKRLRKIGEDNGIHCNQSHAPFPCSILAIRDLLKRAIECTAIAGGKICIIHPCNNENAETNAEMYFELLPFAKEHGVKIATENMWNWDRENDHACRAACSHHDDFLAHIKAVNDPDFVACLDIGHSEMRGLDTSAREMILTLGEHLQALHIHDVDKHHDNHQIPFSLNVDFETVIRSLKEIDYKGYLTLEAEQYLKAFDEDNIFEGMKNMANAAKKLSDMYENM